MFALHKILPPVYILIFIFLMLVLRYCLPGHGVIVIPEPLNLFGAIIATVGFALVATSANLFRKSDTPIRPFTESTFLVQDGAYRFSRNPMYFGMTVLLLGIAVMLGNLASFFFVLLFWVIINYSFIPREEKMLEEIFGESYLEFKKKVGRWL